MIYAGTHTVSWRFVNLDYDEPAHGEWNPDTRRLECGECHRLHRDHAEEIAGLVPPAPDPDWPDLHRFALRQEANNPRSPTYRRPPDRSRPADPCPAHGLAHPHRGRGPFEDGALWGRGYR